MIRFRSRIEIAVPAGWRVIDYVVVHAPDGTSVVVQGRAAQPGEDVHAFAARHGEELQTASRDVRLGSTTTAAVFAGRGGIVRRDSIVRDDQREDFLHAYCLDGEWAYVAAARLASDAAEDSVVTFLRRVSLAGLGAGETRMFGNPEVHSASAEADWQDARRSWSQVASESAAPRESFTAEELLAVAAMSGAVDFAGVDSQILGGLDSDEREIALRAAARSLVAREVAVMDGDAVRLSPSHRWLQSGTRNDLLVVLSIDGAEPCAATLALTPSEGVVVRQLGTADHGLFETRALATGELIVVLRELLALDEFESGDAEVVCVAWDELLACWTAARRGDHVAAPLDGVLSNARRWVRILTLHRDAGTVVGGELIALIGAGSAWLADDRGHGVVQLTPVSSGELFAHLLTLLPGGS